MRMVRYGEGNSWWMYMHNSYDRTCSYDWNSIQLKRGYNYWLTFTLQSYQLLERPYPTDCTDYYNKTEYMSRKDCIRQCKLNLSLRECGVVPHEVDIYRDEPVVRLATDDEYETCVFNLTLNRVCPKMCPHYDCYKQIYKPVVISYNKVNETCLPEQCHTRIRLVIPSDTQTTYYHKPNIEIIEFVCYLASTLSIWFGFSVISTMDWFGVLLDTIIGINRSNKIHSKRKHYNDFHFWLKKS